MGITGFDVTKFLAKLCEDYRVPVNCTSDGGPNLTAKVMEDMIEDYSIHHRISSVANPHPNVRAELEADVHCVSKGDTGRSCDVKRSASVEKRSEKKWSEHTRALAPLKVGNTVRQSPPLLGQEGDHHEVGGV
jgi:hypothetical protein